MEFDIELLGQELSNYEQMSVNWDIMDSVRTSQIESLNTVIASEQKANDDLQVALKRQQYVTAGSILVTIILAILCVIK